MAVSTGTRWQPGHTMPRSVVRRVGASTLVLAASCFTATFFGGLQTGFTSAAPARAPAAPAGGVLAGGRQADGVNRLFGDLEGRGHLVAMMSQAQGGRNRKGQMGLKIKSWRRDVLYRARKKFGSHDMRKTPRRYAIYDILEDLEKRIPTYTIISEPAEPMPAVRDVSITQRYPWIGEGRLDNLHPKKLRKESGIEEDKMEPYFGDFTREMRPPLVRREKRVTRRGWPHYNMPPWLNRPLIGTGGKVPKDSVWKKDRRFTEDMLPWKERKALEAKRLLESGGDEAEVLEEVKDEEEK